jgi:catechol 2,3-dioxygenase-like lactoylglutathione lyase family enzyme
LVAEKWDFSFRWNDGKGSPSSGTTLKPDHGSFPETIVPQSLSRIALIVCDYDEAIAWFTGKLGFTLVEDSYQPEQDKRWVIVAPPGSARGADLLLARAASDEQARFVGNQAGGRVFLFLHTDDCRRDYEELRSKGVRFVREPAEAPFGIAAVFEDLYGNLWDLVQPAE